MGVTQLLYTGQRALFASRTALQIAGQNIANVNTPGYSRQRPLLTPEQITQQGSVLAAGVDVDQVTRAYDRLITAQLNAASSKYQSSQEQADLLNHIEALFNDLSLGDAGLSGTLTDFFQAFQDVAHNPQGMTERLALHQQGEAVAHALRQLHGGLAELQGELHKSLQDELSQVNGMLHEIADLNQKIQQLEGDPKNHANTLRDERDQLLRQLSEKITITAFESTDNQLTVLVGGGRPLVEGAYANSLVGRDNPDDPEQQSVLLQDNKGNLVDVSTHIRGGKIHGLLAVKEALIPQLQHNLDRLAAQLTSVVNRVHSAGYGLDGSTGTPFFVPRQVTAHVLTQNQGGGAVQSATVFDPTQVTLDDYRITFVAAGPPPMFDIVNTSTGATVAAGQTYTAGSGIVFDGLEVVLTDNGNAPQSGDTVLLSTTQDAAKTIAVDASISNDPKRIAAAQTPVSGDNANALALADLGALPTLDGESFTAFYNTLVASVGTQSQKNATLAEQQKLVVGELENRRDSIAGVSLDEEQLDLIRFQQAFNAAASFIKVADEMAQTVLSLVR